jgi:hypothetical protein
MSEINIPNPEQIPTSQLKADGKNPNKMSRDQLDRLKTSIKKYGFIVPIITNKDFIIADGEHRWIAAKELLMPNVLVIRLPVEDVDRYLLRQVMNKLKGEHNILLDAEEFTHIIQLGGENELEKYLIDDRSFQKYLFNQKHPPLFSPASQEKQEPENSQDNNNSNSETQKNINKKPDTASSSFAANPTDKILFCIGTYGAMINRADAEKAVTKLCEIETNYSNRSELLTALCAHISKINPKEFRN